MTKYLRLQTEYMGCRKTKVALHGVSVYISKDHLSFFFSKFGEVAEFSAVKGKTGIATGDIEILITVNRRNFMDIPNVLTCGG